MRASDGSHYVAFTAQPSAAMPLPAGPALLYVRLAHASPSRLGERSQIREWLAGTRADPATDRAQRHRDRRDADLRPDRQPGQHRRGSRPRLAA